MTRGLRRTPWMAAAALLALAACAFGYYPFVRYTSSSSPYGAAPERFDLNSLPGHTVFYFVSSSGPEVLAPGDSFASVLSQIRAAAKAWNDVETSELRFEFGGFSAAGVSQKTPGVDVYFGEVELPPGIIALGGPTSLDSLTSDEQGPFVPITRSILVLGNDLSARPSYSDAFFLTVLHELGHALGLQHSLTSGAMSTDVTRAVTRSKPISADDVAGISLLYPKANFAERTGSISGKVTLDGVGVHLASVVALDPAGSAVSALTDPDGSYVIRGLSPGQYYLYAHPLPAALQEGLGPADIVLPVDSDGQPVAAGPLFDTVFYPGVKAVADADVIVVKASTTTENLDFAVQRRGALDIFAVTTYSFPGNSAVKPAFLNVNGTRKWLVAYGNGLVSGGAPAPGLSIKALGSGATVLEDGLKAYAPSPVFLQVSFSFNPFAGQGPRHLLFTKDGNIFVLPAAFHLVRSQPPSVASVSTSTDDEGRPVAVVSGSNLGDSARVLFDGLPATVRSMDEITGDLTVTPPVGASAHRAVVNVVDTDGQDSLFLNPSNPVAFTYPESVAPAVSLSTSSLPAGSETMVEISGTATEFIDGETVAGFGSSDVAVRRVWAIGPDRLWANVHVAAAAAHSAVPLTVATGFQTINVAAAVVVGRADTSIPVVVPTPVNPETGQPSIYAGGKATVPVAQLPDGTTEPAISLTVGDAPAVVLSLQDGKLTFEVPGTLDLGPAVLRLAAGGIAAAPVVVEIDAAPPVIQAVRDLGGITASADHPAVAGDTLLITVTGLADDRVLTDLSVLEIRAGGVRQTPVTITTSRDNSAAYDIRFDLTGNVAPGAEVPVTVGIGSRVSLPFAIAVRAAE